MKPKDKSESNSGPAFETEILIRPNGEIIVADLTPELLEVARKLNPEAHAARASYRAKALRGEER